MSKMQRDKGKRGELEVCSIFRQHEIPAKRISPLETNHEDKGDIKIADLWIGEVKLGNHVPKFVYDAVKTEDTQFLFMRRDRKKWLICIDLNFFLDNFF